MTRPVRVAVVGAGVGRQHAAAYLQLLDRFELIAICDRDVARARELADLHRVNRVCTELGDLCQMDDLEVVDLCTPPAGHVAQIEQVLAAGKHVICEKPLAGSLREVDRLAEAERAAGRRVMPIFQYRFGRGLQELRQLVELGIAGVPYLATAETAWRRRAEYYRVPWRGRRRTELGGALLSHAIHALDMLVYVLGPVSSVFARTATRVNPIEVEDCAAATIEFAGGALATLAATLGSSAEISRHRFCFANLSAESNTRPYDHSGLPWTVTPDSPDVARRVAEALATLVPLPEGYAGQFYRYHEALRRGRELPVTLADARATLEVVTALYVSARTGEAVRLPIGREDAPYRGWLP